MIPQLASFAILGAIATMLVFALALVGRAGDRSVARRVGLVMRPPRRMPRVEPAWGSETILADRLRRPFALLIRRKWGISSSPSQLLLLGSAAAAGAWILSLVVLHLPTYWSLAASVVGFFLLPHIVMLRQQRRSDAQFAELLPDAIDVLVRVVRAGLPVGVGIRTVGRETQPPLSTVFTKVADQTDIGIPLDQAMARTSDFVGNPDLHFLAVAIALQQATGGNLAATLETLSLIIRKRRATRLKAMAATAEVRISAIVLGALPFLVTAALLAVAPKYLDPLFVDPRGHIIIGLAVLGLLLAGVTMRGMIRSMLAS